MLYSDAPQVELKMFSFLIKNITKNSKKQFRNAHSMVITARIISYSLKVDWNIQNKCESRIKFSWLWSNLKNSSFNFCSASLQSISKLSTSKLNITLLCYYIVVLLYVIKQLLDEVEHNIMNYQNRGLCYLPQPSASADNTDTRFW